MDKKTSIDEVLALVNLASGVISNHDSSVRLKLVVGGDIELLACFDNCMDDRTLAVGMDDVVKMLNSILNNESVMIAVPLAWATRRAKDPSKGVFPTENARLIHDECKRALEERAKLFEFVVRH